jgi:hypothetical protein
MFSTLRTKGFQIDMLHHAEAILRHDMPDAAREIEAVLANIEIPVDELVQGGGGEGQITQRMRRALTDQYRWKKHNFEIKKIGSQIDVPHHTKTISRYYTEHCHRVTFVTSRSIRMRLQRYRQQQPHSSHGFE